MLLTSIARQNGTVFIILVSAVLIALQEASHSLLKTAPGDNTIIPISSFFN